MPQLDISAFFNLVFWFSIFFFSIYVFSTYYLVPIFLFNLRIQTNIQKITNQLLKKFVFSEVDFIGIKIEEFKFFNFRFSKVFRDLIYYFKESAEEKGVNSGFYSTFSSCNVDFLVLWLNIDIIFYVFYDEKLFTELAETDTDEFFTFFVHHQENKEENSNIEFKLLSDLPYKIL